MRFFKTRLAFLMGACALAAALPGCRPKAPTSRTPDLPYKVDASGAKHYPLAGEVLKVDAPAKSLLVRHGDIAGLMPGMTMEFPVSDADLAAAKVGERIRADLVVDAKGDPRLENIWPDNASDSAAIADASRALHQDTLARGHEAYREIGETIPDFALYDQDGRVVTAARFRGKQVMLNFIYTRCPFANMCPAATANMASSQRKARAAGVQGIEFVSITLDPDYDTPAVLKSYARDHGIDTSNFSLLTGPDGAIADLLTQFGILADKSGGYFQHSLATLLIDEHGKIIWRADGTTWSPDDFVQRMHKP